MPSLDINSYEAAPLILIGVVLPLVALVQVWLHVPNGATRVVLGVAILALPLVGSLIAFAWVRRYTVADLRRL